MTRFTSEEIKQIKVEAKNIARESIIRELTAKIINDELDFLSNETTSDQNWVIPVLNFEAEVPLLKGRILDAENFRNIKVYGNEIRINRSGTRIERLTKDGDWKTVKIQKSKDESGRSYVQLPNVEKKVTETPYLTVLLCRLVIEAFGEKPEYIKKVANSKHGDRILHGLHLCKSKGSVSNNHIDNLEWVCEAKFMTAIRTRMARMKEKARMKN